MNALPDTALLCCGVGLLLLIVGYLAAGPVIARIIWGDVPGGRS